MLTCARFNGHDVSMSAPDFGTMIRKARQRRGMKQQDLAEQVGVDRSAVSAWERGKHFPVRYRYKVESILDIDLAEQPDLPAIVAEHDDDPNVMAIWAIEGIPARTREGMIFFYLRRAGLTADV